MGKMQLYDRNGNPCDAITSFDSVMGNGGNSLQDKFNADEIPLTMMHNELYAVTGRQQWFYFNQMFIGLESSYGNTLTNYRFVVSIKTSSNASASSIGSVSDEGFCIFTNTADDYAVTIDVYNTNLRKLGSFVVTLHVKAATQSTGKNILYLSSSSLDPSIPIAAGTPEAGVAVQAYYALKEMGIEANFVGSKDSGVSGINVRCEGRGGYDWDVYGKAPTSQKFRFFYESGTVEIGDVYADSNGSVFSVFEVGVGYINTNLTSGSAPVGTTLTKQSGGGSSTITFTSFEQTSGNPLWNPTANKVDAAYYREQVLGMTGKFDIVIIDLGANYCMGNVRTAEQNAAQWGYAETIINSFLEDSPNCKVIVCELNLRCPTLSPWSENYGVSAQKINFAINAYNFNQKLLSELTAREDFGTSVFIGDGAMGVNKWVGYQYYDARKIYLKLDASVTEEVKNVLRANTYSFYSLGNGFSIRALYYDERGYLVGTRFLGTAWTYRNQEFVDSRSEPIDSYWVRDLLPSSGTAMADANHSFTFAFTELKIENNPLAAHQFTNALHPSAYGNRMRAIKEAAQIACLLSE